MRAPLVYPRNRRLLILGLAIPLLSSVVGIAAPEGAAGLLRLSEALRSEQAESLRLVWTNGVPGAGPYRRLRIESGRAGLESCAADCKAVGTPLMLSAGERAQLLSRLRAADLGSLRDGELEAAADRQLEVAVAGLAVGQWRLPRADWPAPPDGYGVADFLDDMQKRIEQTASIRPPLPIPHTVAELSRLRVQLRVRPRARPGGLIVVENGRLDVTPEEGSLARTPRPRPFQRPLSTQEQDGLLKNLAAAQLDELDRSVPRRAQPAIGDDDGRLVTLHLLAGEQASGEPTAAAYEPRGCERYLADLLRSPSAPLVSQLVGWLITEPPQGTAKTPPAPSGQAASRRHR